MTLSLTECIAEVEDVLSLASESFDVWRELTDAAKQQDYEPVLRNYETFFQATIRAHFLTLVTCSYSLYDTTKGTHTIPRLLDCLEQEKQASAPLVATLRAKVKDTENTWCKIKVLRHNVFAHRSAEGAPESWFSEAKLTPDQLSFFILENKGILDHVAVESGMQAVFEEITSPQEHTRGIMQALKKVS